MSRTLLVVALLLLLALPVFAQGGGAPGGQGGPGGGGGRDRGMAGMAMGMMSQPPVMVISDGQIYVIYMGQLSVFKADTLELVKTVALPMPAHWPQPAGGPGGPPPGAGPPPAAPQ